MRRYFWSLLAVVFLLSLITPIDLHAGTVYVEKITTSFTNMTPSQNKWYDYNYPVNGQGRISFNAMDISGTSGLINTHPAENPLYQFALEGKLTFLTPLAYDNSAGGRASAYFEGGATVILSGGIKYNGTFIYGGTGANAQQILQASMVALHEDPLNPTLDRWRFWEDQFTNGKFEKGLDLVLTPQSVGLASGITLNVNGTDVTLKMLDPKMDLALKVFTATNFLADLGPSAMPSDVKFTAPIPEPATLVLLGLGFICLRKVK